MGDSGSHRHAALWVLFAAWPKGARGWLYCVPGIRVSFCVKGIRLCSAPNTLPFLFFPLLFCSYSHYSYENAAHCNTRVNKWMDKWTSGWKCRQGDKCIVLFWSIWNKDWAPSGLHSADNGKKKSHAHCNFFLLNIAFEIWAEIQQNSFFFSQLLKDAQKMPGCLVWVKWMTFPLVKIHCLHATDSA